MTRYTKMGGKKTFVKSDEGGFNVTPLIPRKQEGVSNHSGNNSNNNRNKDRGGSSRGRGDARGGASRGNGRGGRGGGRGGHSGTGFKRGRDDDFGKNLNSRSLVVCQAILTDIFIQEVEMEEKIKEELVMFALLVENQVIQ